MYRDRSEAPASQQRYNLHAMTLKKQTALGVLLALTFSAFPVAAQDWPQWRGPNRDGVVASFAVPASWPETLAQQWEIEVGAGYATPVLVNDRLYVFSREGDDEVMRALNPESGETLWETRYPAPFDVVQAAARHGKGPKATPTFADGRLFTLGMSGIVTAFDAETGAQLWQRPGDPVQPLFHTAMSAIVEGDLAIVHVGGHDQGALTAFEVDTGDVRWSWDGDGPAYGSPMIAEFEGTRQVVVFTQANFVGVSIETGELLWRRPFTTRADTTSQTPIFFDGDIIQAGRGNGITRIRVVREGTAWTTEDVWETAEVSLHMANGVVVDGVLYGLSHLNSGQYFGLDLDSGEVLWTSRPRQADHSSMLASGDTLFSLEDDGELLIFDASRNEFSERRRYEVASSASWGQPTLSGNRMFVRGVTSLALWTVE